MRDNVELFTAKLSATLNLLWGVTDPSVIFKIAKSYIDYKQYLNVQLEQYIKKELILSIPGSLTDTLRLNNIFYSYCFGLFKIVPMIILAEGYPVAVLMSESLKSRQSAYFHKLKEQYIRKNGWNTDILFLSHLESNLLFKIKYL